MSPGNTVTYNLQCSNKNSKKTTVQKKQNSKKANTVFSWNSAENITAKLKVYKTKPLLPGFSSENVPVPIYLEDHPI